VKRLAAVLVCVLASSASAQVTIDDARVILNSGKTLQQAIADGDLGGAAAGLPRCTTAQLAADSCGGTSTGNLSVLTDGRNAPYGGGTESVLTLDTCEGGASGGTTEYICRRDSGGVWRPWTLNNAVKIPLGGSNGAACSISPDHIGTLHIETDLRNPADLFSALEVCLDADGAAGGSATPVHVSNALSYLAPGVTANVGNNSGDIALVLRGGAVPNPQLTAGGGTGTGFVGFTSTEVLYAREATPRVCLRDSNNTDDEDNVCLTGTCPTSTGTGAEDCDTCWRAYEDGSFVDVACFDGDDASGDDRFTLIPGSIGSDEVVQGEVPRIISRSTGGSDTCSSTSEINLASFTIPANALGASGILRVEVRGEVLQNEAPGTCTGGACDLTLRVRYGSTVLWGDAALGITQVAVRAPVVVNLTLANLGDTSSQTVDGFALVGNRIAADTGFGVGVLSASTSWLTVGTAFHGTATENSTGALTLQVTAQWDTSSAAMCARPFSHVAEVL
jgi:hypothetical protein